MKRFEEENSEKESNISRVIYKEKKVKKLSYKEEQTLLKAEAEIEVLENEKKQINIDINQKASEMTPIEFQELSDRLKIIEELIVKWFEIWTELSMKQDSSI